MFCIIRDHDNPPASEELGDGMQVNGYVVHDQLGKGAFGSVFKVSQNEEGDEKGFFAMKILNKSSMGDREQIRRLQREINAMAAFNHPSIVRMHDFFQDSESCYMILDLCSGGDLSHYLARLGAIPEYQAAHIFYQLADAVRFAHLCGVAHRDIKPQNILITTFPYVKLSDFGLCGILTEARMRTFCGSPCYAAPECLQCIEYDGKAADVWSLGVILFDLVTGQHPWDISNTSRMIKQIQGARYVIPATVSDACRELIKGCLRLKPEERLTCDDILGSDWMRLVPSKCKNAGRTALPSLAQMNMIAYDDNSLDPQITSPFEHGTPLVQVVRTRSDVLRVSSNLIVRPAPFRKPGRFPMPRNSFIL
jgi:serine/threonine protein kinase